MLELVRRFENGQLSLPPHQRGPRWNKRRRQRWISRITGRHLNIDAPLTPTKAVGIFLTYQTTEPEPSPIYLNDGAQRLTASKMYLDKPEEFTTDTPEQAAAYLDACMVSIQHRHYPTTFEAITDFQLINNGTHLTPFEFCKGILTYMPHYHTDWEHILTGLHAAILEQSERVCYRPDSVNDMTRQKHYRNNYAMFYRFLTKQKLPGRDQKVGASKIPFDDIEEGRVIEAKLKEAMEMHGPEATAAALSEFIRIVTGFTNDIANIWEEVGDKPKDTNRKFTFNSYGVRVTHYRWLLEVGIMGHLNNVPQGKWLDFLRLALTKGSAGGRYEYENETGKKTMSVSLSAMGKLATICAIIGSNFITTFAQRKSNRKQSAEVSQ